MENLGNLSSIHTNLSDLNNNIQESVKSIISKQDYLTCKTSARKTSTGGNNFLGELYEVDIEGITPKGNKDINLFIKYIIHNDNFTVYSIPEVYEKEVFFYKELSKIYTQLQDEANIPLQDRLNVVNSYTETNKECIVLDNLTKVGFTTMAKMELMSYDFAKLSVEQLAKLHGLSFVLQNKRPEYFETKVKTIKQSFVYDEYWNSFVKKMYDISVAKLSSNHKQKLDKFFQLSLEKYPKYMNGLNSSFKGLCHGDYKMNNILLKKSGSEITKVVPIDYQQIYYGCPVIDLIYFLYASSDRSFRKNHLDGLRDIYFATLMRFLNYFDIGVESVYPRLEFERSFKDSIDYALMYTLYMLPMFGYVKDDAPSGKDDIMEVSLNIDERFYVIMHEIVEDFVDLGILI